MRIAFIFLLLVYSSLTSLSGQGHYRNFKASVYTRAYEVQKMKDPHWLDSTWQVISSQMKVDKIYLETHRDLLMVDKKTLLKAKKFFENKGLEVAGGITYTLDEGDFYKTFCYTRQDDRKKVKDIIEFTASVFNEIILDDFFFTNCKCDSCVNAKGDRSWSDYRLELMTEASKDLILGPAKAVNPNVRVIIKYPNWYDHFQEMGFNLETQPSLFDGIYTGTETRDAVYSDQHLQPYLGYLVFRYFSNLKPGKNGGGWVDTGGMNFYDRYAEQLWLTIFAKAPEMTFFDYRQLLYPHRDAWLAPWKDLQTSFDYAGFLPVSGNTTVAKAAGHSLEIADKITGELGNPYGIKCYKPFHSSGEDFLENYLGMIGIPLDLVPEFPEGDELVLLTEHAKKDPQIIQKIKKHLLEGKKVIITTGLLDALQDRGIRELVNLEFTSRKSYVSEFMINRKIIESKVPILIPQVQYNTNDSWEMISAMDRGLGWPLLLQAGFGNGKLYVLTIPENFADLYNLPQDVLDVIRQTICKSLGIELKGGAKVSLFLYDNNTFIVESFNDEPVEVDVQLSQKPASLTGLPSLEILKTETVPEIKRWNGRLVSPEKTSCRISLPPHSFRAVKISYKVL